jgi:hypothetical protein
LMVAQSQGIGAMWKIPGNLILHAAVAICLLALAAGCSPASPAVILTKVPSYADAMTENILKSLNANDYDSFSRDFDQTLKDVLTKATFDKLYNQIKPTVGDYRSKLFVSFSAHGDNTTMLYIASYSLESAGVSVSVVFQELDGMNYVHGLNLDSPILRGQPIDVKELRAYADYITEKTLVALTQNDHAGFIIDLDRTMQNVENQTTFDQLYQLIKTTVGDYISITFVSASVLDSNTTARYFAKYTDEPDGVWVTISFDSDHLISGLYFSSPKLGSK